VCAAVDKPDLQQAGEVFKPDQTQQPGEVKKIRCKLKNLRKLTAGEVQCEIGVYVHLRA